MYMERRFDTNGEYIHVEERFFDLDTDIPAFDVSLSALGRTLMALSIRLWAVKRVRVWRIGGAGTYERNLMKRLGEYLIEQRSNFELVMGGRTGWGESMDVRATTNGVARFHVYAGIIPRSPSRDIEIRFDRAQAKQVGARILKLIEGRFVPPERPVYTDEDRIRQLRDKIRQKDALIKRLQSRDQ